MTGGCKAVEVVSVGSIQCSIITADLCQGTSLGLEQLPAGMSCMHLLQKHSRALQPVLSKA